MVTLIQSCTRRRVVWKPNAYMHGFHKIDFQYRRDRHKISSKIICTKIVFFYIDTNFFLSFFYEIVQYVSQNYKLNNPNNSRNEGYTRICQDKTDKILQSKFFRSLRKFNVTICIIIVT